MTTAKTQGIATHYLRYSTGSLLVIMAGLVSFPVLTRLLDNTQYGILGYYDTWVLMAVAIGKLGAQHAIMRFYPHGGDAERLRAFSTNLFYLPLGISLSLWAVAGIAVILIDMATGGRQSGVFWLAVAAAPLMVFASLVETVLRVTENSRMVMVTRAGWRWLELVLMLGAVVLLQHSAVAAYGGKLLAAMLVIVFYARWMRDHLGFSRSAVDPSSLREGLIYGMPLVANEIIAVALVTLDRLMIKGIVGDFAAVGVYSIGASLAMQVNVFMNLTVFEAFTPMANRLYMTEGAAAVRALKARVLMPMTYAAVGVASLLWCFGADVIIALSGHAKAASGPVFAMVGLVYALQPVLLVAGYGLLLEKRTVKVMALMCFSLVVNAALNLVWIPAYGVMGAVYATAVSSAALAIAHCAWVPRELMKLPEPRTVLTAGAIAAACVAFVTFTDLFGLGEGWPRLLIGGSAMGVVYASAVLLADARLRNVLLGWILPKLSRRAR
ncbi:MAG: oligosaccharide flippase family protein [Luteimonas sp.]